MPTEACRATESEQRTLKVVIVEPHHHALEEIHAVLRQQRRLGHSWSLCHIDAHPDLACPSNGIPAAACFRPNDEWHDGRKTGCLYELLDLSTTGISEWILPLVLAGGLSFVEWVKPPAGQSTSQIPLGRHRCNVGAFEQREAKSQSFISSFTDLSPRASVKVDWDCLYYRDDDETDFFAPLNELQLPQSLDLHVVEWPNTERVPSSSNDGFPDSQPWILDICLDYFYCVNPFLADIELIDKDLASVSYNLVGLSTFYNPTTAHSSADREKLLCFRRILADSLRRLAATQESQNLITEGLFTNIVRDLEPFIGNRTKEALEGLGEWKARMETHDEAHRSKLLELIIESLPHAMLPHSRFKCKDTIEEHVARSLDNFEGGLRRRLQDAAQLPFLVTIARSMHDGFTPESLADLLQSSVTAILHKCLCGDKSPCSNPEATEQRCCLQIVLEY